MSTSLEQLLQQAFLHFSAHRLPQAEAAYRKVLDRRPQNHEAIHMLAVIAHKTGDAPRAGPLFDRALELSPNNPNYLSNAGKFFAEQSRHEKAVPYYQRAVILQPTNHIFLANLAESLRILGHLDEAESAAKAAIALVPDHPDTLTTMGNLVREQGRLAESIDYLRRSLAIRPYPSVHDSLLFTLHYDPSQDPAQIFHEHLTYGHLYADHTARRFPPAPYTNDRSPNRRLRVGYVSADFFYHPVMDFLEATLAAHDPTQIDLHLYSNTPREDDVTERIKSLSNITWHTVTHVSLTKLAERIRRDQIDLLVDLSGHTAFNRLMLFAVQPAPVQLTYLGNPGTTGLSQIQYRITDAVADPPGQSEHLHTEKLLRLPNGLSCFTPSPTAPPVAPLPALTNNYITFGSLHTLAKINDRVLDLWAQTLLAVPHSKLLLLRHTLTGSNFDRYHSALLSRGIPESRLDLRHELPPGGHLAAYREIDIALDVFPFAGHTTACEGLYQGVPILTHPGPTHASRLVASVLTQLNLPHLICPTPDSFITAATHLASDLPALATLRATLRDRMLTSPLCDAKRHAAELESLYRQAWQTYCCE